VWNQATQSKKLETESSIDGSDFEEDEDPIGVVEDLAEIRRILMLSDTSVDF